MKYIVSRTSAWHDERPVKGAVMETVHPIFLVKDRKGYKEWVKDIDDINAFIDENGPCILSRVFCEEGYRRIEIYDDYRE
mgnify:CR=1 FL=1